MISHRAALAVQVLPPMSIDLNFLGLSKGVSHFMHTMHTRDFFEMIVRYINVNLLLLLLFFLIIIIMYYYYYY